MLNYGGNSCDTVSYRSADKRRSRTEQMVVFMGGMPVQL